MNRRAFIQLLSTGIVGYELDVDRLLWTPGQKTIFIPKPTVVPLTIYGIPYHECNGAVGSWLGINRIMGDSITKELSDMITLLEKDKYNQMVELLEKKK
jgi:hypothetical protein